MMFVLGKEYYKCVFKNIVLKYGWLGVNMYFEHQRNMFNGGEILDFSNMLTVRLEGADPYTVRV